MQNQGYLRLRIIKINDKENKREQVKIHNNETQKKYFKMGKTHYTYT